MPFTRAIALPMFDDNYLWLLADERDRAILVDPGDGALALRTCAEGFEPQAVLVTHHHGDHIGGLAAVLAEFDIPCFAPADARIPHAPDRVADGERLRIEAMALDIEVMAVPGHTRSHLAYLADSHLFCGDTLFSLGCGRLFEGRPEQMLASLDRLAALPEHTAVCCAHEYTLANARFAAAAEPDNADRDAWVAEVRDRLARGEPGLPSRIGIERRANPFLRSDLPPVRDALQSHTGRVALERVEAFARLRAWKDGFR